MVGGSGDELGEQLRRRPRARRSPGARATSGASRSASASSASRSGVTSTLDLGAEAQRVLDGVEAFEHGQRGVAPRAPEARDERSVLHAPMIARRPDRSLPAAAVPGATAAPRA